MAEYGGINMEVFKIWSTLNLRGNAVAEMEKFTILSVKAAKQVALLQKSLGLVSKEFNLLNTALAKDNIELKAISDNFSALSLKANSLAGNLRKIAVEGEAASISMGRMRMGGGFGGRGGHGGIPHLGAIGMGEFGESMGFMGGAGMIGGAGFAVAAGGAILVHQGFEAQKEYQKRMAQLQALGFSPDQMKQADILANQPIKGVSQINMVESIVAAQMATRAGPSQWSEVQSLAPQLAKARFDTNAAFGGMTEKQQQDLIRFAEIQGGSSHEKQAMWLKAGTAMMIASGGSIMPNKQLQFSQLTAGSLNLTPESYLALEPVLQELQSRTGTGLTTGVRALAGAMSMPGFSKKNIQYWEKMGLFKGTYDKVGRGLDISMPKEWQELLTSSPDIFLKNVILPLLASHGVTKPEDIHQALLTLPRTYGMEAWTTYKNMDKIDRARAMSGNIMSGDALHQMVLNTPEGASMRASAAWNSFATAVGKLTSPAVIIGLNALSTILEDMASFINHKPKLVGGAPGSVKDVMNESLFSLADKKTGIRDIKEPSKQDKSISVAGNVYLDKNRVGEILAGNLHSQLSAAGTLSSPTAVNASYGMPPVGLSNYGGQQ